MDTHFTSSPRAQFSCFLKLFIFALGDNAVLLSYCPIKRTSPFEPNTCFPLERMMGKCLFKSLYLSTFLIYKKSLITQIPRDLVKSYSRPNSKRKGKIKYCLSFATTGTKPWQCALKVTRPLLSSGVKIQKQVVSTKKTIGHSASVSYSLGCLWPTPASWKPTETHWVLLHLTGSSLLTQELPLKLNIEMATFVRKFPGYSWRLWPVMISRFFTIFSSLTNLEKGLTKLYS